VLMALLVAVWREWVHHEVQERDAARLHPPIAPPAEKTPST
ncbi:MAG TPA: AI-2E family transporter, partial [Achromobacter sp.]|nr:AI-2E family transporter [Achromobacter sp.]